MTRLGEALASVHSDLELHDDMRRSFPEEWFADGGPGVFVHGDLSTNNVCWDSVEDRLIIVDWSSTPMIDPLATVAPACFDVHWLVSISSTASPCEAGSCPTVEERQTASSKGTGRLAICRTRRTPC